MATVTPVSFGLTVPKYAPKSNQTANSTPVATKSTVAMPSTSNGVVPNQRSAIAVLLGSAFLCTVAIANLIKAGR